VLLNEYRARLDEEPMLVVPSLEDVEHTQRELADGGAGVRARAWCAYKWLFQEIAARRRLPREEWRAKGASAS